jgi:hypothetical protein
LLVSLNNFPEKSFFDDKFEILSSGISIEFHNLNENLSTLFQFTNTDSAVTTEILNSMLNLPKIPFFESDFKTLEFAFNACFDGLEYNEFFVRKITEFWNYYQMKITPQCCNYFIKLWISYPLF